MAMHNRIRYDQHGYDEVRSTIDIRLLADAEWFVLMN